MLGHAITEAIPMPERHVAVTFADGLHAAIALDALIDRYEGVFAPLMQDDYFRQLRVDQELGTICWPNGVDLCPDVLHAQAAHQNIVVAGDVVFVAK